jgi:hypothetical protein
MTNKTYNMATIKVIKTSSVKSIKKQFAKEFNCNIRIYNGKKFAEDETKISELSKKDNPGGELVLGARSRVGNVENYFMDTFGIKVQVSNADDSKLAKNDLTLTQAGKL